MDWFWKLIGVNPSELDGLTSAEQALIETLPAVALIVVIVGVFSWLAFRSGQVEEEEEGAEKLSELDLEIALIRKLQKK